MTLGSGIPAAFTRPGRALIGLCDWIETDFSAGHFRRLLQSGDLGFEERTKASPRDRPLVCLGVRKPVGGARLMVSRLDGFTKSYESRAADQDASDEDRADAQAKAESNGDAFVPGSRDLLASLPEPASDGKVPLQAVVSGVLDFLERTTARSNALDYRAAALCRIILASCAHSALSRAR